MIPRLRAPYSLSDIATAAIFGQAGDIARFEAAFANTFGFPCALFFPYGRSALYSLLQCFGWRGRDIVMPAYVCAAVPHAAKLAGNEVVFADSAHDHFLVPADELERKVHKTAAMVVAIPMFGYPVDRTGYDAVIRSKAPDAFVLYDVAQGFGTRDSAGHQASRADAALFSLGISKVLSTLYGGVLCLRDEEVCRELKSWRDRRFDPEGLWRRLTLFLYGAATWAAFREPFASVVDLLERRTHLLAPFADFYYALDGPHLPDNVTSLPIGMQGRLGLSQLAQYEALASERRAVSQWYDDRLRAAGFATFAYSAQPAWSIYPLAVADRGAVVAAMRKRGIQLGIINNFSCADLPGYEPHAGSCPNAAHWGRGTINLPNWPGLGMARAQKVIDSLLRCRDTRPDHFDPVRAMPAVDTSRLAPQPSALSVM
jgi:dTDP-4-amino-4,6-dideoxygalactose transaminase